MEVHVEIASRGPTLEPPVLAVMQVKTNAAEAIPSDRRSQMKTENPVRDIFFFFSPRHECIVSLQQVIRGREILVNLTTPTSRTVSDDLAQGPRSVFFRWPSPLH